MSGNALARARFAYGMVLREQRRRARLVRGQTQWPPMQYSEDIQPTDVLWIARTDVYQRRVLGLRDINRWLVSAQGAMGVVRLDGVAEDVLKHYVLYAVRLNYVLYEAGQTLPRPFAAYVEMYLAPGSSHLRPRIVLEPIPGAEPLVATTMAAPERYRWHLAHTVSISLSAGASGYRNQGPIMASSADGIVQVVTFSPQKHTQAGNLIFDAPLTRDGVGNLKPNEEGRLAFANVTRGTKGVAGAVARPSRFRLRLTNPRPRNDPNNRVKMIAVMINGHTEPFVADPSSLIYEVRIKNPPAALKAAFKLNREVFIDPTPRAEPTIAQHPAIPRHANMVTTCRVGAAETTEHAGLLGYVTQVNAEEMYTGDLVMQVRPVKLGIY